MTSARRTVERMAAVVRIREVERLAAEEALHEAERRQRDASEMLDGARAEHEARERAWSGELAAARLDLDLTRIFAAAVNASHSVVGVQSDALKAADVSHEDAARELRLAQGRLDAASEVSGRLQRRVRRRAEQDQLDEHADRIARVQWRA